MATTSSIPEIPDPEVLAKATRRRFTAAEKARILDAYEASSDIEKAAICRRERVYSSLLSNWRKQRAVGNPLAARRGPKPDPDAVENTRLQKRTVLLEQKLAKAERVIDIQGKPMHSCAHVPARVRTIWICRRGTSGPRRKCRRWRAASLHAIRLSAWHVSAEAGDKDDGDPT